ncbi:MAG: hypothetical protein R6W68_03725, partial [Ignavibacteriaceae bacterium]
MKLTIKTLLIILLSGQLSAHLFGQERPPIIDMHLHADLPPHEIQGGERSLCRPEPCEGESPATANHDETLKKTLEIMDRYNIVKAHLSGLDSDIIAKWIEAAPDRFIAAPFIFQPGQPKAEDLRQKYDDGFYTGMGEIATQLNGIAPNDPRLEPY